MLEVLRLALYLRNDPWLQQATFPNDTAEVKHKSTSYISIYESGSKDSTVTWLKIAEALWTGAGIPNKVVINGKLTRQTLMDPYTGAYYKQHRIEVCAEHRRAPSDGVLLLLTFVVTACSTWLHSVTLLWIPYMKAAWERTTTSSSSTMVGT